MNIVYKENHQFFILEDNKQCNKFSENCLLCNNIGYKLCGYKKLYNPLSKLVNLPYDKYEPCINLQKLYGFIKDINVCDYINYEEKESILYFIKELIDNQEKSVIDDRLIISKTFYIRIYNFLKGINQSDTADKELNTYIKLFKELFNFQLMTVTDEKEIDYLKNINHIDMCGNLIYLI